MAAVVEDHGKEETRVGVFLEAQHHSSRCELPDGQMQNGVHSCASSIHDMCWVDVLDLFSCHRI